MYGSIVGWRAYATARGDSAPSDATDAEALAALTRASDYVRLRYVANLRAGTTPDTIPSGHDLPLAEEGAYIAAAFELTSAGFFSTTFTPSQQKVLTGVGSVKWSVVGNGAEATYGATPTSTQLEALFFPYINNPDRLSAGIWTLGPTV